MIKAMALLLLTPGLIFGGQFSYTVTAYCNEGGCKVCNGKWAKYNRTASGAIPKVGVTCAGPTYLPFGTVVYIQGVGKRIVQDRLAAKYRGTNRIDVFMATHKSALQFGKQTLTVTHDNSLYPMPNRNATNVFSKKSK